MYNFDEKVNRRDTACVKWDTRPPFGATMDDVIPMWVADMDFKAAPFITEALQKRVEHGIFGYTRVPESYYHSVINWFGRRYEWEIKREEILYTSGVVPAISACIKAFTKPGDKVLIFTPSYNCFFSSIKNNGCEVLDCKLVREGNRFAIDFNDFERKCEEAAVILFCSPHNPVGRVWTKDELEKVGKIARKHNVPVLSDEIHCELITPGYKFIPFAGVSEENRAACVTMNSPSKNFNIAGLQIANIITSNEEWRKKIDKALNINEVCDVNPFGVEALQAAYTPEGEVWLEELNRYINVNFRLLCDRFREELPQFIVTELEGTYLAWVDIKSLGNLSSEAVEEELLKNEKVWVNAGSIYGCDGFLRINLACSHEMASEGIERIIKGLRRLSKR